MAYRQKTTRHEFPSEQPEAAQFGEHSRRRLVLSRRSAPALGKIGWRICGRKIAPALERSLASRLHRYQFRGEPDRAEAAAFLVVARLQRHNRLTHADLALDHPIERSTGDNLVAPLRHHPGEVMEPRRLALAPHLRQPAALPLPKIGDAVAADAELDQMQRHRAQTFNSSSKSSAPSSTRSPTP